VRITELFVRENGINILLETLRHYQEEARVVDKCCATLWNILQTDESSLKRVERALGLTIVCEAWKLHENHENVVASAAGLVTRLIQRSTCWDYCCCDAVMLFTHSWLDTLSDADAMKLVTRLIQRSTSWNYCRAYCCCDAVHSLLARYTISDADAMKLEFVVDHRGSEMTISSLKRHLNSKFTVSACLSVLANLCIAPKGDIKSDSTLSVAVWPPFAAHQSRDLRPV